MEFRPQTSDGPILRLAISRKGDVERLVEACFALARSSIDRLALHEQEWVVAGGACRCTWVRGAEDVGVRLAEGGEIEFVYAATGWADVAHRIGPPEEWPAIGRHGVPPLRSVDFYVLPAEAR